jgi:hypothetical protein
MILCMNMYRTWPHPTDTLLDIGLKDIYPHTKIRCTDTWLSLRDLIIFWRGFRETIKRSHCYGNEEVKLKQLERKRYLPAEKYPYLLLRFYDTYTYYYIPMNLLAF